MQGTGLGCMGHPLLWVSCLAPFFSSPLALVKRQPAKLAQLPPVSLSLQPPHWVGTGALARWPGDPKLTSVSPLSGSAQTGWCLPSGLTSTLQRIQTGALWQSRGVGNWGRRAGGRRGRGHVYPCGQFMFMDIRKEINIEKQFSLVQFCRSVSDSWQPVDRSMPGPPVHHQLPEFTQTHVHRVGDAIQPSHPLSSPSPPTFNLSQHQGLFTCQLFTSGGQSIGASASASVLSMNIQVDFL